MLGPGGELWVGRYVVGGHCDVAVDADHSNDAQSLRGVLGPGRMNSITPQLTGASAAPQKLQLLSHIPISVSMQNNVE